LTPEDDEHEDGGGTWKEGGGGRGTSPENILVLTWSGTDKNGDVIIVTDDE